MKKFFSVFLFLMIFQQLNAQFNYRTMVVDYIEFQGKKYVMPKQLNLFINEVPMDEELRTELNKQVAVIQKKKKKSTIILISGISVGSGVFFGSMLSAAKKDQSSFPVAGVAIGGGLILGSYITSSYVRPRSSDYRRIVNTYNDYQNKKTKNELHLSLTGNTKGIGLTLSF